jgi:S-adenosylmethionine synthetase
MPKPTAGVKANPSTIFTSESVCAGHPDKMCDQIRDSILDEILRQDPMGRVAVEAVVGKDFVAVLGEVATTAKVDYEEVIRRQIKHIGYTDPVLYFTDSHLLKYGFTNSHRKFLKE